jgi:hypothetical protein
MNASQPLMYMEPYPTFHIVFGTVAQKKHYKVH